MILSCHCHKTTPDSELIDEAQRGNREAYGELVLTHQARLHASILPLVHCPAEADDVVQETVIRAFEKLPLFQGHSGFFTWLYRIAVNRAISRRRRRRDAVSIDQTLTAAGDEPRETRERPDECMLREEQGALVREAINRLDADQQEIVLLRYRDGFDYRTIAGTLDIPEATARTRLHRARRTLRKALTKTEW